LTLEKFKNLNAQQFSKRAMYLSFITDDTGELSTVNIIS